LLPPNIGDRELLGGGKSPHALYEMLKIVTTSDPTIIEVKRDDADTTH
jgi:hypothetical protein